MFECSTSFTRFIFALLSVLWPNQLTRPLPVVASDYILKK